MLRIAAISLMLSSCVSPQAPIARPTTLPASLTMTPAVYLLRAGAIPRIVCLTKQTATMQWSYTGSGVWIGKNIALTADHVVAHAISCSIEGEQAKIIREDGKLDYALVSAFNQSRVVAAISCDGIVPGREYRATGYADGETYQRSGIWLALSGRVDDPTFHFNGLNRFSGLVIEGMSGGPVTDEATGRVVGIVNAGNTETPHDVWGRSLADTPLCGRNA